MNTHLAPEAELALVGGLLLSPRGLTEVCRVVTELDLYRPQCVAVFRAMRLLEERGESIDLITVEAQLRRTGESELVGGIEGLAKLDLYATAGSALAHAEIIRTAAQSRRVLELGRRMAEDIAAGVEDVEGYLGQRLAELTSLAATGRNGRQPWTAEKVIMDLFGEKIAEAKGTSRGVDSGMPALNRLIKGKGYRSGMLIVLGGRPKMGKTSVALAWTRAALLDRAAGWPVGYRRKPDAVPVLWACDEMRATELMERTICDVAGVHGHQLASPSVEWLSRNLPTKLGPAKALISDSPLHFVPDRDTHHLDRIFDYARHWRASHPITGHDTDGRPVRGPAIIVVDYLQRFGDLPGMSRGASQTERVGAKVKLCKTVAQDLDVIVVLLSQLNRELEKRPNKRPMASDFRDSGEIEQEADVLIGCYRGIEYEEHDARRVVYDQIDELTSRSGLGPDQLDAVLALRADPFLASNGEVVAWSQSCKLHASALDELARAKQRVTETELVVIANRHGPKGTVLADFYGSHYRFLPRAEEHA